MTPEMARGRAIVSSAGNGIGGPCARLLGGRVKLTCVFLTRGLTRATGRTSAYHRRRVDHTRRL